MAQTLVERLPATVRLLDLGQIGYLHAAGLAEAVFALNAKQTRAVEDRVLPRAPEQTLSEFKRSVRRAVARVAAATVEEQRVEAMALRRVALSPRDDGMTELWALPPAEGAAAIITAVDALASVTSADDPRTPDQRRADALVDLGVAALHDPLLPKAQGMRPSIQVTVALSTLLGEDEQPGELAGHGPIPASLARRLAADESGTWRRLVTDPVSGQLLDYGPDTYRPPKDLAEFVIARDQACTFPGVRHRPGLPLRTRSSNPLWQRRIHQRRQHRCPLRTAPHLQAPSRLDASPARGRIDDLDQPHQAHLPLARTRTAPRYDERSAAFLI